MLIFGPPWPSRAYRDGEQSPTPVGAPCLFCLEPIEEYDRGFTFVNGSTAHAECQLLAVIGHDFGVCSCTGFDNPSRDSARELWRRAIERS